MTTHVPVRFYAQLHEPVGKGPPNSVHFLPDSPDRDVALARAYWVDGEGRFNLIRTEPPAWKRTTQNELLWHGNRYLVGLDSSGSKMTLRLPLMADGQDMQLLPYHSMTWGAVIPTLLPSAGWEAELMPLGNNVDIVTIIADAPSKIYRIRPYITPRYDDTLKVTFDRTDTFTMDSE